MRVEGLEKAQRNTAQYTALSDGITKLSAKVVASSGDGSRQVGGMGISPPAAGRWRGSGDTGRQAAGPGASLEAHGTPPPWGGYRQASSGTIPPMQLDVLDGIAIVAAVVVAVLALTFITFIWMAALGHPIF